MYRATKRMFRPQGKRKLGPSSPNLQIMILKSIKESVQQKWIDELWFRKQLSTCLFVWTLDYNSWSPEWRPGWPPSSQWAWWCIYVSCIDHVTVSTICLLDYGTVLTVWYFGTVLTVWYFLFFISLHIIIDTSILWPHLARWVPLVEQELLTLPEHLSSSSV